MYKNRIRGKIRQHCLNIFASNHSREKTKVGLVENKRNQVS